jgi:hypothetical protein
MFLLIFIDVSHVIQNKLIELFFITLVVFTTLKVMALFSTVSYVISECEHNVSVQ